MNCYKCATPVPEGGRFCTSCGVDVSGDGHEHAPERTIAADADPELMLKLQADLGGEYVLERELGRGGMAVVFLGHDTQLGRKVAVKLLPPELHFAAGSQAIERFRREARTAATLDHPNIIPVYRVSQGGKLFWYVMKFLPGAPLDQVLQTEGPQSLERTVRIITQTAAALDYAHRHQVVHRDIKPANVMLDEDDRVTVTDFGIAKALDAHTLTATGSMIGTPYYMSPEQCAGKRVGPASDQYSLGVMTFQMLGGHPPFTGDSVVDIVRQHVMDPVPPLAVLRPQLSAELVAVVERALAKQADDRFASCAEFARSLEQASQGVAVDAPPRRGTVRLSATAAVSPVPGMLRSARTGWTRRRLILVGTLVAASGAGALTIVADNRAQKREALAVAAANSTATAQRASARASRDSLARSDSLRADSVRIDSMRAAAPRTTPPPRARANPAPATTAVTPPPAAAPPEAAPAPAPRATTGHLSLGTQPRSTIYVNGRAVPRYPLVNHEVPSGTLRLRFQVADSTGLWWAQDREVTVNAGDTVRLGFIRLVRP